MNLFQRPRQGPGDTHAHEDTRALATALRTCAVAEVSRRALVVALSRLPPEMSKPHHLRLVRTALEPLIGADRAQLFKLQDETLVLIWRGPAASQLQQTLAALDLLFADFGAEQEVGFTVPTDFVTVIDLPAQIEIILQAIEDSVRPEKPRQLAAVIGVAPVAPPPLTLTALELLERSLAHADVARFVRRRPVCTIGRRGEMSMQWEKRNLSISELTQCLIPDYDAKADPWLFRRLTRTLDRRMLALLSDPDELRLANPFALNINVGGILSPEFLKFDANIPGHLRGELVLSLLPSDVLADPAAFSFARNFARERGYRLLLRGLTAELLAVFPRRLVGVDLLQLSWSAELEALSPQMMAEAAGDPQYIVLAGVDHAAALRWGQAGGIRLFQGSLIQPSIVDVQLPPLRLRRRGRESSNPDG